MGTKPPELPAPVVTITDPARPSAPADVLSAGHEKPPWRPRRPHYQAAGLLVAVIVAAVVPDAVVSSYASDRRAGVAADESVRVSLAAAGSGTAGGLPVLVSNDGRSPVTVLDVTVLAPGQQAQRVTRRQLSRGATAPGTLPDTMPCSEQLVAGPTSGLARVRVRTSTGHELVRQVVLDPTLWADLRGLAQVRCGYLPATRAFATTVAAVRSGGALELHLVVTNRGRLPLTVTSFGAQISGLLVSQPLPLLVPARSTKPVPLVLRVTINGCQDLAQFATTIPVELGVSVRLSDGSERGESVQLAETHPEVAEAIRGFIESRCSTP